MSLTPQPTPRPSGDRARAAGWKVLLAAQSTIDQQLAVRLFAKHGHEVHVAGGGPEAVSASELPDLDAVIIDWWLSNVDGLEVAREIQQREQSTGRRLPILILLDQDDDTSRERCHDAGFHHILSKPLGIEEFAECMTSIQRDRDATPACPVDENPATAIIRWDEALDLVGGRRELLAELVGLFFEEYPPTLDAIRTAIERLDAKGLQLAAHKMKGCLRYFGHSQAAEHATVLEQMGRAARFDGALPVYEQLAGAIARLLPGLRTGPDPIG